MIGIILITHTQLAQEFQRVLEHIVGPQQKFVAMNIEPDAGLEECREKIIRAIEDVKSQKGVLILTDMFGGTPSNVAISLMEPGKVEVIAGLNLPMLLKLVSIRKMEDISLLQAVDLVEAAGKKYIIVPSKLLHG